MPTNDWCVPVNLLKVSSQAFLFALMVKVSIRVLSNMFPEWGRGSAHAHIQTHVVLLKFFFVSALCHARRSFPSGTWQDPDGWLDCGCVAGNIQLSGQWGAAHTNPAGRTRCGCSVPWIASDCLAHSQSSRRRSRRKAEPAAHLSTHSPVCHGIGDFCWIA
jgi:hypothetical protein